MAEKEEVDVAKVITKALRNGVKSHSPPGTSKPSSLSRAVGRVPHLTLPVGVTKLVFQEIVLRVVAQVILREIAPITRCKDFRVFNGRKGLEISDFDFLGGVAFVTE